MKKLYNFRFGGYIRNTENIKVKQKKTTLKILILYFLRVSKNPKNVFIFVSEETCEKQK